MCGRYANAMGGQQLAESFSARDETGGTQPNFNVAPTASAPVVVIPSGQPAPAPRLRLARWGLVPSWANDVTIGNRMINARAETVAIKPAFRAALRARRCLVPITGYYEWHRVEGVRRAQPYLVRPADSEFGALAGLYELWRCPSGDMLATFTIITTTAPAGLEFLHPRSPVVIPPAAWSHWLDPGLDDPATLTSMLGPAPAGVLRAYPVSSQVGNVRNNGPHLLEPVTPAGDEADGTGRRATHAARS
ncbi:SOS response-associated peptidase [Protofrankia symbiont of Coriaria ruscifolia]|uniref:SOS response-associated peptidase n=1 Tax=Protofrankia symbiont of Coriaria ruscifolia TaxID=1306542 RepID=UPI0010417CFC|nr:SOS response-associated peptidase [Protofrankia symbiont of Coriaria ruscifolia]